MNIVKATTITATKTSAVFLLIIILVAGTFTIISLSSFIIGNIQALSTGEFTAAVNVVSPYFFAP